MDFVDRINELAARAPKQLDLCKTEEATKNALVLPFIAAMGYDVFNPAEVMPELTADFGTKKGEKVDYAVFRDGRPIMVFECKKAGTDLSLVHASQLYRYFSVLPDVRFGVLSNGTEYRFFSDLDKPNVMDEKPFFVFDLLDFQDRQTAELKKFTKTAFNLEDILATASELKYTAAMLGILRREFDAPSDEFVAYLTRQVYTGRITHTVREQFTSLVRKAVQRFLNEQVNARLQSALQAGSVTEVSVPAPTASIPESEAAEGKQVSDVGSDRGIVTTEAEIEAYFVVKSILREVVDVTRIHISDQKQYCNVQLDGSNRKVICRLYFNRSQKYIGLLDAGKQEQRVAIKDIDEIYDHAARLIATVKQYDAQSPPPKLPENDIEQGGEVDGVTGKKPRAIVVFGQRQSALSWKEVWFGTIEAMLKRDRKRFESEALTFRGRVRPYFSLDPSELRAPERVPGSELYVETNLGATGIVNLSKRLLKKLGYAENELEIVVE